MTRRMPLVATMALLLAAAPADTPDAAFERYRTEINLHDFDRLARSVIHPDARFVFAGESHRGVDAVRASFNRTWATIPDEVYTMDQAEWLSRDPSSAVVAFRYRYRGTLANGRVLAGGGYGTNLYRRTSAGWRLAYEHLSPDPALTPKPAQ